MSKQKTSSTSKATPKAGGAPSPSIGTTGITQGEQSTEGGQFPFMPACSSYSGAKVYNRKSGPSESSTKTSYPFLPEKAGGKA